MERVAYFRANFKKILLFVFVFSLFFPIRHVFVSQNAYATGAYSDFTSFSLYLSDILLIFLVVAYRKALKFNHVNSAVLGSLPVLLGISFTLTSPGEKSLGVFFLVKVLELGLIYFIFKNGLNKEEIGVFLKSFIALALLQVGLAFIQFAWQGSVGLSRLGESHLAADLLGVAKISLNNAKFIRPYGTFPHPNLLSAFLLTAVAINSYFLFHVERKIMKILLAVAGFLLIFGLFITFSRSALLALGVSLIILFGSWLWKVGLNKKLVAQTSMVIVSLAVSGLLLAPFLSTRATISDTAAKQRVFYSEVGLKMIKNNLLLGVGPGVSVLHMKQYSPIALQPWEIQPIHNYFLVATADLGILSALILVVIFLYYLIKLIKTSYNSAVDRERFSYRSMLLAIFASYLVLMMFDHYFYTIQQTQFLLWIIIGLVANELGRGQSSLPAQ